MLIHSLGQKANPQGCQEGKIKEDPQGKSKEENHVQQKIRQY
jgi:hypothetical protein